MYKSFDFLNKIYFVRTGGSPEEEKAADLIIEECKSLGVEAHKEAFNVDGYKALSAKLSFKNPDMEFECVCVGMSGSTPDEGILADFTYITSYEDAQIQNVEGKICLVHSKLVNYKIYKKLCEKKAAGLILCTGSVYKDDKDVDLDPYMYRERHYTNGKIPAVCIRMRDAEKLLRAMPEKAYILMKEEELQKESHNVVAEIRGTEFPEEIVSVTAHYDSVNYSKGAYDNGTGAITVLQMLAHFKEHAPKRTVRFIWCGSEEMGLLGSKAYVKAHKEELEKFQLSINIDMTGVTIGTDIACCTADMSLVHYIRYMGLIQGFAISAKQGVYSSDSTPFADNQVPSLSFARLAPAGGATIHSHDDVMDWLSEDNYYKTCDFIAAFADSMVNAKAFPVERKIPDNMVTELDYYMGRKERP